MNIIIPDSKIKWENKLAAEKMLIDSIEFSDTNEYWDTLNLNESFLKDADTFFNVISEASHGLAFSAPWQIVNHIDLSLGNI